MIRSIFSFRVLLAFGLTLIYVLTISNRFNDPDLWFHLRLGEFIWSTRSIPTSELFSHTAFGHPWIPHEWLAQLGIYAAWRLGGVIGLMGAFAALGSLLFVLLYILCYRHSGSALVALMGGVCGWFFGTIGLALRPHLAGYTFLVVELLLLDLAARNRRYLWGLPPLFALWVNCHGSYYFGSGVLGIFWICSMVRGKWGPVVADPMDGPSRNALTLVLLLSGLALCLNPQGVRLLVYPLDLAVHQPVMVGNVEEWQHPDLGDSRTIGMIAALLAIIAIPVWRRSELRLRDLLLVVVGFLLAAQYVRMLFVFGIVAAPVLARVLAPLLTRDNHRDHQLANAVLMTAFAASMVWFFPDRAGLERQVRQQMPVDAVDYIRKAGIRGPMLNEHAFGGYAMWALPESKTFVDGRGDVFDWTGVLKEYGQLVTLAQDPRIVLEKYRIGFCLLSKASPLAQVLPHLQGWQKAYADGVAVIFVRRESM